MPQRLREDEHELLKWPKWLLGLGVAYIIVVLWALSGIAAVGFDADLFLYLVAPMVLPLVFFAGYFFEWLERERIFKWLFAVTAVIAIIVGLLVIGAMG